MIPIRLRQYYGHIIMKINMDMKYQWRAQKNLTMPKDSVMKTIFFIYIEWNMATVP